MNLRELQKARADRVTVGIPQGEGRISTVGIRCSRVYVPEQARVFEVINAQIVLVDSIEIELVAMTAAADAEQAERDAHVWPSGGVGFDLE